MQLRIHQHVVFVDDREERHDAYVTRVWKDMSGEGLDGCNVIYLGRSDTPKVRSSIAHRDSTPGFNYWELHESKTAATPREIELASVCKELCDRLEETALGGDIDKEALSTTNEKAYTLHVKAQTLLKESGLVGDMPSTLPLETPTPTIAQPSVESSDAIDALPDVDEIGEEK